MGTVQRQAASAYLRECIDQLRAQGFEILATGNSVILCRETTITTLEATNGSGFLRSHGTVTITTHEYDRRGALIQKAVVRKDVTRRLSRLSVVRRFDWTTLYGHSVDGATQVEKTY